MTDSLHAEYIRDRLICLKKKWDKTEKWETIIVDTTHDKFIKDCGSNIFTNLVKDFFTKTYLSKHKCECGKPAKERCHGVGEERPLLLRKALEKVYPDTSQKVKLRTIIEAFIELHIDTNLAFKCTDCHRQETNELKLSTLKL